MTVITNIDVHVVKTAPAEDENIDVGAILIALILQYRIGRKNVCAAKV
jgi:hypothetical protein